MLSYSYLLLGKSSLMLVTPTPLYSLILYSPTNLSINFFISLFLIYHTKFFVLKNTLNTTFCCILSPTILKIILYNSNVFFNPDKSLFSIMTILFSIYPHGGNAIVSKSFEYSVFYNRDTSIKLSFL